MWPMTRGIRTCSSLQPEKEMTSAGLVFVRRVFSVAPDWAPLTCLKVELRLLKRPPMSPFR